MLALLFTLLSSLVLGINWWQIMRSKDGVATAALWGSLALYSIGTAALVLFARGELVTAKIQSRLRWVLACIYRIVALGACAATSSSCRHPERQFASCVGGWSVRTDIRTLRSLLVSKQTDRVNNQLSIIRCFAMALFTNVLYGAKIKACTIWLLSAFLYFAMKRHD